MNLHPGQQKYRCFPCGIRKSDKTIACFVGIACFHTLELPGTLLPEQGVGGADRIASAGVEIRERIIAGAHQFAEHRLLIAYWAILPGQKLL